MVTVMAVGITTTSGGEGEGDISTPLVVGDAVVDAWPGDETAPGAGWVRKAPRSSTIRIPRPARAVTAIEAIRPAVVEMRGGRWPGPLGATEERYASKRNPAPVTQYRNGESTLAR